MLASNAIAKIENDGLKVYTSFKTFIFAALSILVRLVPWLYNPHFLNYISASL